MSNESSVHFDKLFFAAVAVIVSVTIVKQNTPNNKRVNPTQWLTNLSSNLGLKAVLGKKTTETKSLSDKSLTINPSSGGSGLERRASKLIVSPNKDSIVELHGKVLDG